MTFSFAVIDFEASSLDEDSYPIEVGIAIVRDERIDSWSSLIRIVPEWASRDAWSRTSESVHGISRRELIDAPRPSSVMQELNDRTRGLEIVYCDGGDFDVHWLRELSRASAIKPTFRIADINLLLGLDRRRRNRFAELIAATSAPHRAGPDAKRLAEALRVALAQH